ncbi:MAG: LPS export ABC transporter ATP-binding protein [Verrucomicrobiales bacterium]|nr:LPS export ABC transporter ATP-binding protein [Verrucomicrobiales bacterium]
MSYSDDRDEIAELFGKQPKVKKSGYSEELPVTNDAKPSPKTGAPPQLPSGPKAKAEVEVAVPVKLRPPAHVEPHPLDEVPSAPASKPKPAEPEVVDEEFIVYDEAAAPDFLESEFVAFEEKNEAPAPPKKTFSSLIKKRKAASASTSVENEGSAELPPVRKEEAPAPVEPQKAQPQPGAKANPAAATASLPAAKTGTTSPTTQATVTKEAPPVSEPAKSPVERTFSDEPLLDTKGLVKIYDGRTVVNGVAINVKPGEIVGLLGPNGAGKTTSFYMMVGLVPPNDGTVMFNGNDVTKMPMYKRARLGMGYLPQEESIFRKLTVEQNIMAVMETLSIPRKEKIERCNELLERFSITHIRKNIALTCSGGEKRRVTIARSLVTQPSLVMLDEPFSGVDPIAVNEIQGIVADLRDSGLAILITDHNARQTLELVDRAYLIYEGKVLREGTRDFLINDPVSRELYLGDRFTM